MAYFDHSAAAPPDPIILTRYFEAMQTSWYNPASIYPEGREAAKLIETCQERLNTTLAERAIPGMSGSAATWLLTSGASESIVTAIRGTLHQRGGKRSWTIGFAGDHQATLQTLKDLKQEEWPTTVLPINSKGEPDIDALETELQTRRKAGDVVRLVTILQVNNETGAVADIEAIHELRQQYAPASSVNANVVVK